MPRTSAYFSILVFSTAACLMPSSPAMASEQAGAVNLETLVARHTHALEVEDGRLTGEGGDWIKERARTARYLMLGESHMTAEIPLISTAIWKAVAPLGFDHAAIETSPWTAEFIEDRLESNSPGAYERYLAEGNVWTIPFYTLREEVGFLEAVVESADPEARALWGLDQVFTSEGKRLLQRLRHLAGTERQQRVVDRLLDSAGSNPEFVGNADPDDIAMLQAAFSSAEGEAARIVADLAQSHEIYGPFSRGRGDAYTANFTREQAMKRRFVEIHAQARESGGEPPGVLLKFGAFHMFRGHTPTHVLGLGNFVTEFATARGTESLALLVICADGEAREFRTGEVTSCQGAPLPEAFEGALPSSGYPLFDLAALRPHAGRWSGLPEIWKKVIWSYDAAIVVPEATAGTIMVSPGE